MVNLVVWDNLNFGNILTHLEVKLRKFDFCSICLFGFFDLVMLH